MSEALSPAIVSVEHVFKSVTDSTGTLDILRDIDFRLAARGTAAIVGASGSGKSLFLRALADLDPHRGAIFLDDTACAEIPAPQWRRRVGLLPAESQWWFDEVSAHFPEGAGERLPAALGFTAEVMDWSEVTVGHFLENRRLPFPYSS
jgi:ABC-type bacteriocin/lantibiotic exporter with double-glycine peptidase domain